MEPKYGLCVRGKMGTCLFSTREIAADERLRALDDTGVDPDDIEMVAVTDP